MSTTSIPRPVADESAHFYQGYIAEVKGENIADQLREQAGEVERIFQPLDDTQAQARYAPDKWSVKEVLGHLIDAERIFGYRLLRIARGDVTPLAGFDEKAYVPAGRFDERPLPTLVAEFRAVRESTRLLIEAVPSAAWPQRGEASGDSITARALAYIIVGHVTHHLGILRDRYRLG